MAKKTSFRPDFGQNLVRKTVFRRFYLFYLQQVLYIVASYHRMQFQGKIMNQIWKNYKNLVQSPIFPLLVHIWAPNFFSSILPPPVVRHCCKLSLYAILRKTNEPNLRKQQKKLVLEPSLVHLAKIRVANFFFLNLAPSVTRYHGQLSSCTISEETYDSILRKLSDRRTGGQTDR